MNYTIDEVKNILASKKSQICNLGISHTVLTVIQDLLEYQTPKNPLPNGTHKGFNNYCCPSCKRPLSAMCEDFQMPYFEYHRLTDQMFSGVAQTDTHLNQYTEILRQYLINGGAANTMLKLGIGIQVTTKRFMLLPKEVVMRRFIWLKGSRKGELLDRNEIEAIGMFLPGGALYGKEDNYIWD